MNMTTTIITLIASMAQITARRIDSDNGIIILTLADGRKIAADRKHWNIYGLQAVCNIL